MSNSHSPAKPKSRSNSDLSTQSPLYCEPLERRIMLATVDVFAAGATGEETMEVRLFDQVLATFENVGGDADAGVFEKYSFEVDFEGGEVGDMDDLFIAFTNDRFIPGELDRNLRVDAIVLSEFEGETGELDRRETEASTVYSTGTWKPEDGVARGYRESEFLHSNGFFSYSNEREGGTRVQILASGSEGGEQFDLQVDGQTVETFTVTQNGQDYFWEAPPDQRVDYDQVRIVFTNDVFDPENGIDSNLIVDDVQVGRFSNRDGAINPRTSRTVFSTGSYRPEDGIVPGIRYSDTLHANGYFQFGVFDVASPGVFGSVFSVGGDAQRTEDSGGLRVLISRFGATDGEVTIDYATRFGTADASDFTPVSGTAVFPDGVRTVEVSIPLTDDDLVEDIETLDFLLSNPTGGALLNTSGAATTLEILDNDTSAPGVIYAETFESAAGDGDWTFDPFGTDTASHGQFEIGLPEETTAGGIYQLGSGSASSRALVTGAQAGTSIGSFDVDGGVTSALSPEIVLPTDSIAELNVTYNFAHTRSATADDQLRIGILVNGQVVNVLQDLGNNGAKRTGEYIDFTTSLEDFAGNPIQILFEAEDASSTIIEAAIGSISIETLG